MLRAVWRASCLGEFVCALSLAMTLPYAASAQAERSCHGFEVDNPALAGWLREFYAKHAQPILGAERRLANGVAWRLVIDAATRLASPRITWMPDRQAMQRANRFFVAGQACSMVRYAGLTEDWFASAKYGANDPEGGLSLTIPRDQFIWQPYELTALTYATPSLVSGSQVLAERGETRRLPYLNSYVIDLRTEKTLQIDRCGDNDGDFTLASRFRLGDLFDFCDPDAHAKFIVLWKSKIEAMAKTPVYKRDVGVRYCSEDKFERMPPSARWVDLTVTEAGLAVHTGSIDSSYNECMLNKSPFNPVIIPYRELEPFIKPGPWRDEFLKGAKG